MSDRKQRMQASLQAALDQAKRRGHRDHHDFVELLKLICISDSLANDRQFAQSESTIVRRLAELAADNPDFAAALHMVIKPPKLRLVDRKHGGTST